MTGLGPSRTAKWSWTRPSLLPCVPLWLRISIARASDSSYQINVRTCYYHCTVTIDMGLRNLLRAKRPPSAQRLLEIRFDAGVLSQQAAAAARLNLSDFEINPRVFALLADLLDRRWEVN